MHLGPFEERRIADIVYDRADIERRMQQPHVIELAANTARLGGGPMHPLLVDDVTGELLAGRDRLASELLNGKDVTWVRLARFTTARDRLELEIAENVHRRPVDRDALLKRLVDETEKEIRDEGAAADGPRPSHNRAVEKTQAGAEPPSPQADSGQPVRKGRPVTPRGEARKAVAQVSGKSTEAIRKAEERAKAKAEPKEPVEPAEPPINTFGLPLDPELAALVVERQGAVESAATALQAALGHVKRARDALYVLTVDKGKADGEAFSVYEQLRALGGLVRALWPAALCPYGKGRCDGNCNFCRGAKYATAEQMETDIPAELLREGPAAMVSDGAGKFVSYAKAGSVAARLEAAPRLVENGIIAPADVGRFVETGRTGARPRRAPRHVQVQLDDGRTVDANDPPADLRDPDEAA